MEKVLFVICQCVHPELDVRVTLCIHNAMCRTRTRSDYPREAVLARELGWTVRYPVAAVV